VDEHSFIKKVHRLLPNSIFLWKIADPFQGGVPDALYFGQDGTTLFVEYKFVQKRPVRPTTIIKPNLSAQQQIWLSSLHERKQNVLVVLGHGADCSIFSTPKHWTEGIANADLQPSTIKELAETIASVLGVT